MMKTRSLAKHNKLPKFRPTKRTIYANEEVRAAKASHVEFEQSAVNTKRSSELGDAVDLWLKMINNFRFCLVWITESLQHSQEVSYAKKS